MVFGHVPAAVTVLEGIKAKLPYAQVVHAAGPEIRRQVPSMFDMLIPGPKKVLSVNRLPELGNAG
jgi:hypothetical protein